MPDTPEPGPQPFDDIFFDCDSTLTAIEGIDELAAVMGAAEQIAGLTNAAMNGLVPLESVYAERLRLLTPTRAHMRMIVEAYKRAIVPDAREVVAQLQREGRRVFIVSGGLADAVIGFGRWLGIPTDRIFAVGVTYNQLSGRWWQYHRDNPDEQYLIYDDSPLATSRGKIEVIGHARTAGRRAMLVGDGSSDLAAAPAVELFVGFGGVVSRAAVSQGADVFIGENSLRGVLDLARGRLPASGATALADGRWHRAPAP